MDGLTPNLTHEIGAKNFLSPFEKFVMELVQQWGVRKLVEGLLAKICSTGYCIFQK
jgi:hypothetical protein